MILKEIILSNTGNYVKQWSDLNVYIMNDAGEKFEIAYDDYDISADWHYVETDEPIIVEIIDDSIESTCN